MGNRQLLGWWSRAKAFVVGCLNATALDGLVLDGSHCCCWMMMRAALYASYAILMASSCKYLPIAPKDGVNVIGVYPDSRVRDLARIVSAAVTSSFKGGLDYLIRSPSPRYCIPRCCFSGLYRCRLCSLE